jgi:hypothetical protein
MSNIARYMEAIDHQITGGAKHEWDCYPNARFIDSETDLVHVGAIVDARADVIYEVYFNLADYSGSPYRWTNPEFREDKMLEAERRGITFENMLGDEPYVELEKLDDILDKIFLAARGLEFDTRVEVDVELSEADQLALFRMAHERDITFNEFLNEVLSLYVDGTKKMTTPGE